MMNGNGNNPHLGDGPDVVVRKHGSILGELLINEYYIVTMFGKLKMAYAFLRKISLENHSIEFSLKIYKLKLKKIVNKQIDT